MNTRSSKLAISWLVLIVAATLGCTILAEVVLRIANISYPVFDTFDDVRGATLRPGKAGWYKKEGRAFLQINSLGYRDSEHAIAKPADTYRIAVLGDSFAEARQVAQDNTFWSLLGRDLGSECSIVRGKKVEVLNFGIGSYGTAQELLTLRKDALRFSPDLVLLAFFPGNDLQDNSKELSTAEQWRMARPYYVRSQGKLVLDATFRNSHAHKLLYEGIHHSRLLELVNEARRTWDVGKAKAAAADTQNQTEIGTSAAIYAEPMTAAWQEAWAVTEQLLEEINQETRSSGARFMVTTITMPPQVNPDPEVRRQLEQRLGVSDLFYASRKIGELGQKYDFPVVSLAERLQKAATEQRIYFHGFDNSVMGEGHWNETGHRYAAEILVQELCAGLVTQASL